ncbi:MAG: hypothetical protein GX605_02370 [Chloroflexi bacterium]|nr:hypothetical protein [Chloroflexota bacterium]
MTQHSWTPMAPVAPGGTVLDLTLDTQGGLWAATWAGLFRQQGDAWWPTPDQPPFQTTVGLWAVEGYLFAAGMNGGLVRSLDGGASWEWCWLDEVTERVSCLAVSPHFDEDGVLILGTDGAGVLRSADRGRRWRRANVGLQAPYVTGLVCAPAWGERELVFAATTEGLYRSSGGGRAWRRTGWDAPDAVIEALAGAPWPSEPGFVLYLGTLEHGLFRSTDGGQTWQPTAGAPHTAQGERAPIGALWVDPDVAQSGLLVVGTDDALFRSGDGGRTWQPTASDLPAVLCLGGQGQALAAGLFEDGLLTSNDGGRAWAPASALSCRGLARLTVGGGLLYAYGAMEGAWSSTDGHEWQRLDWLPYDALPLSALAAGEGVVLAATNAGLWVQRGQGPGQLWEQPPAAEGALISALALSPRFAADGLAWAGQEDGTLWRSSDGAQSWQPLGQPFGQGAILALEPSARVARDGLLVAATGHPAEGKVCLWRSSDGGGSWEEWLAQAVSWPRVTLTIDGERGIRSWASLGSLVMQPVYSGWKGGPVSPQAPVVMRLLRTDRGRLLAGAAHGVYTSTNGAAWTPLNQGLPVEARLLDLALFAPSGELPSLWGLAAGGAIWRLSL